MEKTDDDESYDAQLTSYDIQLAQLIHTGSSVVANSGYDDDESYDAQLAHTGGGGGEGRTGEETEDS